VFLRRDSAAGRSAEPTVARLAESEVARLVETVRAHRPDFVLFEGAALLDAMRRMRAAFRELPIIVDFHNVESRLYRDVREARVPRWARPLARSVFAGRFRQAEEADREAARIADSVWTCSARDADEVRKAGWAPSVHVIPNPIPDWCRTVAPETVGREGRTVLFVGHLGYPPNRRAVDELVSKTMPRLRRRFPDSDLHVCGRGPRDRLARSLADHGHRLSADPPDLLPAYRDAAVAVIPLRQGGGTRIKVLEALAVGCPVVATAKAVEGLSIEDGRHFLRAETTVEFVEALTRLFEDPQLGARLTAVGKDFVRREYGDAARSHAIRTALAGLDAG
jgi:glycosyltransferase involved in cell wall biosynthesis